MLITLQALAGLALLYFGGGNLVGGAVAVASRLGIPSLAIGLTIVAFGTSAPEFTVSMNAALTGASAISIGNILGSNIANIGLVLGLSALLFPLKVKAKIFRIDAPIMMGVTILAALFLANGYASRLEGSILFTGLILFTLFTLVQARKEPANVQEEFANLEKITGNKFMDWARIILGLVLLVLGGKMLVASAVVFAEFIGMSEAVIGLTIVAIGTSLPEMSATLMAARKGYGDIAIGNIIGSNIFNTLGILGITSLILPQGIGGIQQGDILTMVFISMLAAFFFFTQSRMDRYEGAFLLTIFTLYSGWLLVR